jgi:hypothetical protein
LLFFLFGQIVFGTSALYTVVFAIALDHFGAELFNLNNTTIQPLLIIGIINVDHVDAITKYGFTKRWCTEAHRV